MTTKYDCGQCSGLWDSAHDAARCCPDPGTVAEFQALHQQLAQAVKERDEAKQEADEFLRQRDEVFESLREERRHNPLAEQVYREAQLRIEDLYCDLTQARAELAELKAALRNACSCRPGGGMCSACRVLEGKETE